MWWVAVLGFLIAITPIALTPGASFTLATQQTLAGQERATVWVVLDTATGIYTYALLAAAGLSALVLRSAEAFTLVKVLGGLYLVGLGAWTLWRSRGHQQPKPNKPAPLPGTGRLGQLAGG